MSTYAPWSPCKNPDGSREFRVMKYLQVHDLKRSGAAKQCRRRIRCKVATAEFPMTIATPSECLRHHGDGSGSPVRFVPGLEGSRISKQFTSYVPVFNYPQEAPGSLRRAPRGRRDTIGISSSSRRQQGSSLKSVQGFKDSMLRKQCASCVPASSELCIQCVHFDGSALKVCSVRVVHRRVPHGRRDTIRISSSSWQRQGFLCTVYVRVHTARQVMRLDRLALR